MKTERPSFPPLQMDDLDARLDRRAAALGIPTLKQLDAAPIGATSENAPMNASARPQKNTGLAELAGQGDGVEVVERSGRVPRRVPRSIQIKRAPPVPTPDAPTPRSRMKSLNVELPDYVWVDLKSRAAREMVSVRHVIMSLLNEAGIEIAAVDLIEDGRRLR